MVILTISILLIQKYDIPLHLFLSSLISFMGTLKFSEYRCFVSLETWSFWWTHSAFLGRGVVSLLWKCSPHSVSPELPPLSPIWLLFVNLRPKNLNAVIVTGPTGFVWPRCRDGCRLLPEHRQFHRWRWGQAKGWRPGIKPTSVVTSPGKYDAGGWQGCQKALFLTWSPPCNLTAAVGLYAGQPTHL